MKQKQTELERCVADCLDNVRSALGKVRTYSELEVLEKFSDEFGAEIAGWDMRIQELRAEDEEVNAEGGDD